MIPWPILSPSGLNLEARDSDRNDHGLAFPHVITDGG